MSDDLRDAMLELMSALRSGIVLLDTMAGELTEAAHGLDRLDDGPLAEVMRAVARRQRVKILEMQGQLAGLTAAYTKRFHPWS